jgi:hypothetical protein
MARLIAMSVWFDDGMRYDIDPDAIRSVFMTQGGGAKCGHHGPFQKPGQNTPVKGPFPDSNPPHAQAGGNPSPGNANADATVEAMAVTDTGKCYYVDGVLVCP